MGINPESSVFHYALMFNGLTLHNIFYILNNVAQSYKPGYGLWYEVNVGKTGSKIGNLPNATGFRLYCPLLVDRKFLASQPPGYVNVFANITDFASSEAQVLRAILMQLPDYMQNPEDVLFLSKDWAPGNDEIDNPQLGRNARLWSLNGDLMGSIVSSRKFVSTMLGLESAQTQTYRGVLGVQVFKMA